MLKLFSFSFIAGLLLTCQSLFAQQIIVFDSQGKIIRHRIGIEEVKEDKYFKIPKKCCGKDAVDRKDIRFVVEGEGACESPYAPTFYIKYKYQEETHGIDTCVVFREPEQLKQVEGTSVFWKDVSLNKQEDETFKSKHSSKLVYELWASPDITILNGNREDELLRLNLFNFLVGQQEGLNAIKEFEVINNELNNEEKKLEDPKKNKKDKQEEKAKQEIRVNLLKEKECETCVLFDASLKTLDRINKEIGEIDDKIKDIEKDITTKKKVFEKKKLKVSTILAVFNKKYKKSILLYQGEVFETKNDYAHIVYNFNSKKLPDTEFYSYSIGLMNKSLPAVDVGTVIKQNVHNIPDNFYKKKDFDINTKLGFVDTTDDGKPGTNEFKSLEEGGLNLDFLSELDLSAPKPSINVTGVKTNEEKVTFPMWKSMSSSDSVVIKSSEMTHEFFSFSCEPRGITVFHNNDTIKIEEKLKEDLEKYIDKLGKAKKVPKRDEFKIDLGQQGKVKFNIKIDDKRDDPHIYKAIYSLDGETNIVELQYKRGILTQTDSTKINKRIEENIASVFGGTKENDKPYKRGNIEVEMKLPDEVVEFISERKDKNKSLIDLLIKTYSLKTKVRDRAYHDHTLQPTGKMLKDKAPKLDLVMKSASLPDTFTYSVDEKGKIAKLPAAHAITVNTAAVVNSTTLSTVQRKYRWNINTGLIVSNFHRYEYDLLSVSNTSISYLEERKITNETKLVPSLFVSMYFKNHNIYKKMNRYNYRQKFEVTLGIDYADTELLDNVYTGLGWEPIRNLHLVAGVRIGKEIKIESLEEIDPYELSGDTDLSPYLSEKWNFKNTGVYFGINLGLDIVPTLIGKLL